MKRVVFLGASGRCVMPLARQQLAASDEPHQLVLVEDHPPAVESNGHQVISYDEWLALTCAPGVMCNGNVLEEDHGTLAPALSSNWASLAIPW